jgi:hypothetical protein
MKLFYTTEYDGESSNIILADTADEAIKYVLEDTEDENIDVNIYEVDITKKGIIGWIDWTEPESPFTKRKFIKGYDAKKQ